MTIQSAVPSVANGAAQIRSCNALRNEPVERGVLRQRLGQQRAREHHHIDQEEQADQQRDRAPLVRLDVGVEAVGGSHGSAPAGCRPRLELHLRRLLDHGALFADVEEGRAG